jgi:hypothetical protein
MYGPLVLAGRFEPVTKEMTYSGGYGPKSGAQTDVPEIVADSGHPTAWIEPDPAQRLTFHAVGQPHPLTLIPLSQIIHERYAVYWKVRNKSA